MSSKSLFSEAGDVPRGQPQPSALASKRPRFNVSIYGSPILVSVIIVWGFHIGFHLLFLSLIFKYLQEN